MATATLDDWTEEKCLQLIREYRKRPVLWDKKDQLFFKKSLKPIAWEEIGAALNISADQCKHKMIILMSSFRREKSKIMNSIRNLTVNNGNNIDLAEAYNSIWFAFKEMSFLLDKDSERKRRLNADSDETDDNDGSSSTVKLSMLHHLDSARSVKRAKGMISVKNIPSLMQAERREPDFTQRQPMPGPSQTQSEREEEIKSFTTFIGNKMKKYSDTTKNSVQQAICDIIFRADQNSCSENNCYEKFTIIDDESDPLSKQIFVDDDDTLIKIQNDSNSD